MKYLILNLMNIMIIINKKIKDFLYQVNDIVIKGQNEQILIVNYKKLMKRNQK